MHLFINWVCWITHIHRALPVSELTDYWNRICIPTSSEISSLLHWAFAHLRYLSLQLIFYLKRQSNIPSGMMDGEFSLSLILSFFLFSFSLWSERKCLYNFQSFPVIVCGVQSTCPSQGIICIVTLTVLRFCSSLIWDEELCHILSYHKLSISIDHLANHNRNWTTENQRLTRKYQLINNLILLSSHASYHS